MARLNDLPVPAESIEALKRRFVRQNREIARANSIQSLRIQTLESEVSRLLRENASLRQQVISLRSDVEKYEAAKLLEDGVYDFREKLDIKLAEIGSLVAELGRLPRKVGRVCESTAGTERQNSAGPHRRMAFDTAEEDGRLPVILEDKYFPRKTLEPQELEDMANGASEYLESPKIGTPPIAHFDVEGSPSPNSPTDRFEFTRRGNVETEKDAILELQKPENGLNKADDPVAEVATSTISEPAIEPAKRAAKSGSKRKFSSRDDDDRFLSDRNVFDSDFEFSRPGQTTLDAQNKGLALGGGLASKGTRITKCKVLEPKSTNMQPTSRKRAAADRENRKSQKGLAISDEKVNNHVPVHGIQEDENGNINLKNSTNLAKNKEVDSSTAEGISSTTTTESRKQIQLKKLAHSQQETPEPDVYPSGLASRPTRRPRGAVSYAEPNLRDKMRRPTNEFVDAVGAERFRRVSNSQEETKNTSEDYSSNIGGNLRTMLSREGNPNEVTSTTPLLFADLGDANPTGPFPSLSDLPATVNTERKRRTLSANKDELIQSQDFDTSLRKAASNRRRRRESGQAYIDIHSKTSNDEESMLRPEFENDAGVEKSSVPLTKAASNTAWVSRRYSSNPDNNEREKLPHLEQVRFQQVDDNKQLCTRHTKEDSSEGASPTAKSRIRHLDVQDDRQGPETNQRGSKATFEVASTPAMEGEIKRAQRAAARRRSMLF